MYSRYFRGKTAFASTIMGRTLRNVKQKLWRLHARHSPTFEGPNGTLRQHLSRLAELWVADVGARNSRPNCEFRGKPRPQTGANFDISDRGPPRGTVLKSSLPDLRNLALLTVSASGAGFLIPGWAGIRLLFIFRQESQTDSMHALATWGGGSSDAAASGHSFSGQPPVKSSPNRPIPQKLCSDFAD